MDGSTASRPNGARSHPPAGAGLCAFDAANIRHISRAISGRVPAISLFTTTIWLIGMKRCLSQNAVAAAGGVGEHRAKAGIVGRVIADDDRVQPALAQHGQQILAGRRALDEIGIDKVLHMRALERHPANVGRA